MAEHDTAASETHNADSSARPVTTIVRRRVRPERRTEYEHWLTELLARAEIEAPGFIGADLHPPPAGDRDPTYVSVFRFATLADRDAFERSELRTQAMAEVEPYVAADAAWDTHTGLELWFDPPPGTVVPQPVRWRMALVLGTVVYALVLIFGTIAGALLSDVPGPLRLALVIAVEITLMTYLILPRVTRALARWIYPTSDPA